MHEHRKVVFEFPIHGKLSKLVYTYYVSDGARVIIWNDLPIIPIPKFTDGKEKFYLSGVPCEFRIQELADGQHEYTMVVDGQVVGHHRDPFYKWHVQVGAEKREVTFDTAMMELEVNGKRKEIRSRFDHEKTIFPVWVVSGQTCQVEAYTDPKKNGIAFRLIAHGEVIPSSQ